MTIYKVRRGEQVHDVEGFAALVKLAQDGHLRPDDAVFVPASNRWHYARSIRQLREYFPQVEDPPPPPGKVREIPRDMVPPRSSGPSASQEEADDAAEATRVGEGAGADVVPLRRGRWTPDGKGVQVPVFNYEVDLDPPPAARPLRLVLTVGFALMVGGAIYLYGTGYAEYLDEASQRVEKDDVPVRTPTATPPLQAASSGLDPASVDAAAAAPPEAARPEGTPVAAVAPTPVPLPSFDTAGSRAKVMQAKLTPVKRPDQLGAAMRGDLIKLAVPVRAVRLAAVKKSRKGPVPFDLTIEYSAGDDLATSTRARHYWMIGAMAGRRASELRLNLRTVTIRTWKGEKRISQVSVPASAVKAISNGGATPESFLGQFPDLTAP